MYLVQVENYLIIMIPIPGVINGGPQVVQNVSMMHGHSMSHQHPSQSSYNMVQGAPVMTGQKRAFLDVTDMQSGILPSSMVDADDNLDKNGPRKKGRKKSFIWSHATVDENGKVHCKHCNALIRVNYGEKVERLRRHFVKSCTKSPFNKDSKEYEELLESVNAPIQENRKKSFVNPSKAKSNRVISYSVGFVGAVLSGPTSELTKEMIVQLEANGNRSSNWNGVKLTGPPNISFENSLARIRGCYFSGNIYIGVFIKNTTLEHNISLPSGLYNSNFTGTCVLSDNCYVLNCSAVSNVFVGRNSSLVNCAQVICDGNTSYGTQRSICIGPESSSGRSVQLGITCSFYDVCLSALTAKKYSVDMTEGEAMGDWSSSISKPRKTPRLNRNDESIRYDMTIICDDSEISQSSLVRNTFVGSYSRIKSSSVSNCTLLSHCLIADSEVQDVVMHGSCSITSQCICNGVLMFPQSAISEGAKVSETVMGPDSSVGVGECKRSLVGPFIGFHHQSLLISTTWLMGRGNLAYGSMVGANHTGRTNDQESFIGEGCFFGLGSAVRFPFNVSKSPYSMIAAHTTCQPQVSAVNWEMKSYAYSF